MRSVTHLLVTNNFAGAERYVCQLANESGQRDWQVAVIGGEPERMRGELRRNVAWYPGATPRQAAASLHRLGRMDVCHAHLTLAEVVATSMKWRHRARVISTRHIAAPRGSTLLGRLAAPWVARNIDREIAISRFVSDGLGSSSSVIIHNGVEESDSHWDPDSRVVLLVQRLEPEKHTILALDAWLLSGLADRGWVLRIVGDGGERAALEAHVARHGMRGITFLGARTDVPVHLAAAGIFLATTPREALGLSVLEAMAAGIPVVASQSGGHVETVAPEAGVNGFAPGDARAAAECLVRVADDVDLRGRLSVLGRDRQSASFTLGRMADQVHLQYVE